MTGVRVTYDKTVDAAYVHFTGLRVRAYPATRWTPAVWPAPASMGAAASMGIEVSAAGSELPGCLLPSAPCLDTEGA